MQATLPLDQTIATTRKLVAETAPSPDVTCAAVEIHACLAARNLLLREAEANPTEANLRRATAASDFAEDCLRSAGAPYEEQALAEDEAARERQHCEAIKVRLARLHAEASLQRYAA